MSHLYNLVEALDRLKRKISELAGRVIVEEQLGDVSLHQLHILDVIHTLDHPTATQLADTFRVTRPTITAMIKRLEEHGFIERVRSAEDGRSYTIELTERGRSLSGVHSRIHQQVAKFLSAYLEPDEVEQFARLLRKLLSQVE